MNHLTLSDKELAVVKKALDVFIRTRLGRPEQAMEGITYSGVRQDGRQLTVEETHQADALLLTAAEILTGVRHGGPGLFSDRVSPDARLAYRVISRIDGDSLREGMVDDNGDQS